MRTLCAGAGLAILSACALTAPSQRALPPLRNEGEVYLYLQPLPAEWDRVTLSVRSVAVMRASGAGAPLQLLLPEISGSAAPRQRLLAWGRLPPDTYSSIVVQVARATVATGDKPTDLLTSKEPISIPLHLDVARGRASVVQLSVAPGAQTGVELAPELTAVVPAPTVPELAGYCTSSGTAGVTVFDKILREVTAVVPTGLEPKGIAIDAPRNRLYVVLAGEDQVAALDRITGTELGRIRLRPGDRPQEVVLSPDGVTLLVTNRDSNTASFLDPISLSEIARVPTGEEPGAILVDRSGRRAYVFNARSSSITIVDLAARAVAGTLRTEAEPIRGDLDRAGTRLYVVNGNTAYLSVFSIPDLASVNRLFVGLGASAVKVDPRTDLFYVAYRDDNRVQVYNPLLQLPVATVELPGGATRMTIADRENALVLLLPDQRSVAFVDLTTRKLLSLLDVGRAPYQVTPAGER